jgi:hypothetical protein
MNAALFMGFRPEITAAEARQEGPPTIRSNDGLSDADTKDAALVPSGLVNSSCAPYHAA